MNNSLKSFLALLSAAFTTGLFAQNIVLNGGSADINFFYEAADNRWDVVFREKGTTNATGLTSAYTEFPGIVGLGSDWNFDTLTVNVNAPATQTVNGIDYFVTSANGSTIFSTGTPDLGIRTRLREDVSAGEVDQFDSFRLTLNSVTAPSGAEFILFGWNSLGEVDNIRYETASNTDSFDWSAWGHTHWHFGFSELGSYTLNFTGQGIGGLHGGSDAMPGAPPVEFSIGFNVIPEPSTVMLLVAGAIGLIGSRKLKSRNA